MIHLTSSVSTLLHRSDETCAKQVPPSFVLLTCLHCSSAVGEKEIPFFFHFAKEYTYIYLLIDRVLVTEIHYKMFLLWYYKENHIF